MAYPILYPVFTSRTFGNMVQPGFRLEVERMTWSVVGGCKSARLTASARGPLDLDQFSALLRCGAVIYTTAGRAAWWGLVWSVRIQDGATCPPEGGDKVGAWITLDDLTNRARTVYGLQEPEVTGAGLRSSTTWADDLSSQATYGVKEKQYELDLANASQAESYRNQSLAQHSRISPRPTVSPTGAPYARYAPGAGAGLGANTHLVTIDLRGFWDTLDWRFYSNSTGLLQHITRQPNYLVVVGKTPSQIVAQQITVPVGGSWQVETIWFKTKRQGNPASTITVTIRSDSAGSPGTILGTATMDGTAIDDTKPVWLRYVLAVPAVVSAGLYWITITDSSSMADSNHYQVHADRLAAYAGGSAKVWSGAAWVAITPDIEFIVAGTMETTEQIRVMAGASFGGQFLAGVCIEQPSGIYTNPQRSGDQTALAEITAHLAAGTVAGGKLQAVVNRERYLVVSAQPAASSARWILRNDGILRLPGGQIASPGPDLAGSWAVLDTKWALNSANWLQSPGRVFVETVEWSGGVCRAVSAG